MKSRKLEYGSHHLVLVIVAVVILLGVLGFVGYNAWQKQQSNAGGKTTVGQTMRQTAKGLSCTATFSGIKNDGNTAYGTVTIKNTASVAKKVKVTVRAQDGHPLAWYGNGGANVKWVTIPAKSSKTRNWSTSEYVHASTDEHVFKVVAVWKLRNPEQGLYQDKELVCGKKALPLDAEGQI